MVTPTSPRTPEQQRQVEAICTLLGGGSPDHVAQVMELITILGDDFLDLIDERVLSADGEVQPGGCALLARMAEVCGQDSPDLVALALHALRRRGRLDDIAALRVGRSLVLDRDTTLRPQRHAGTFRDLCVLRGLPSLQRLNLMGCRELTDLRPLATLPRLRHLNIRGCRGITDLSPLLEIRTLEVLHLTGRLYSPAQIRALKAGLRRCTVFPRSCHHYR